MKIANGSYQTYLTILVDSMQDLEGQSTHFECLIRSLRKKTKEKASRMSIDTSCQS